MRTYDITLQDGTEVALRITIGSQMKLSKKYNEAAMATVFSAVADPAKICDVLTEALNYKGNENKFKTGAELYDALVDDGYEGTEDFMELLAGIAKESGLITDKQADQLVKYTKEQTSDLFEDEDEDPKNK